MLIDLTRMKTGEKGTIKELRGGYNFMKKAESMGLRSGSSIKKISSHFWGGPQTIEVGKAKFAVGFGMAGKIFVEVKR